MTQRLTSTQVCKYEGGGAGTPPTKVQYSEEIFDYEGVIKHDGQTYIVAAPAPTNFEKGKVLHAGVNYANEGFTYWDEPEANYDGTIKQDNFLRGAKSHSTNKIVVAVFKLTPIKSKRGDLEVDVYPSKIIGSFDCYPFENFRSLTVMPLYDFNNSLFNPTDETYSAFYKPTSFSGLNPYCPFHELTNSTTVASLLAITDPYRNVGDYYNTVNFTCKASDNLNPLVDSQIKYIAIKGRELNSGEVPPQQSPCDCYGIANVNITSFYENTSNTTTTNNE